MSTSKLARRSKTLEAYNLQNTVASSSASRFVPQAYRVRRKDGSYSATPSTGRITNRSDRSTCEAIVKWASAVMDRRVQLHSNSRQYRFLLNVCELIHRSWLIDEATGAHKFQEFIKDRRRMAYVFQSFVFNFIRIERPDLLARRENIAWRVDAGSSASTSLLPIMQTDVSMDHLGWHIIIDTKFYPDALVEHYGGKKFHTETSVSTVQLCSESWVSLRSMCGNPALSNRRCVNR